MAILITNEEWAALLGTKSVRVNKGAHNGRKDRRRSEGILPQRRIVLTESPPTPSLRDLISNEEITALLARFPAANMKPASKRVYKRKNPPKRFRVKSPGGNRSIPSYHRQRSDCRRDPITNCRVFVRESFS